VIGLDVIDQLTGGRLGTHDTPCPGCGPLKRSARNQRRAVLRVWRIEQVFATYHCARCGESGFARDRDGTRPDPVKLAKARKEAAERDRVTKAKRLQLARWLWSRRRPIAGSLVEVYLRQARGYGGPLPATLGFLPARGDYPPAMIAAFGFATEVEPSARDDAWEVERREPLPTSDGDLIAAVPGLPRPPAISTLTIADVAVTGVHLTRLRPDGSGKAVFDDPDESPKVMIGHSIGSPIVLAAPNDTLGLVVTEGIEDGLSVHEATGAGVWVAGSAGRMAALAPVIPGYTDAVAVVAHDDDAGRRGAADLSDGIRARGIEARTIVAGKLVRGAA
jgi:Toprim domain